MRPESGKMKRKGFLHIFGLHIHLHVFLHLDTEQSTPSRNHTRTHAMVLRDASAHTVIP